MLLSIITVLIGFLTGFILMTELEFAYYRYYGRNAGPLVKVIDFLEKLAQIVEESWKFVKTHCTKEELKKFIESCKAKYAFYCEKAKELKETIKKFFSMETYHTMVRRYTSFEFFFRNRMWAFKMAVQDFITGFESVSVSVINRDSTPENTTKFTFDAKHVERAAMFLAGFIIFIHLVHIYFTYDGDVNTRIDQVAHSVRNLCDCVST